MVSKLLLSADRAGSPAWNARGEERIRQNVRNLLSLLRYEVAYDRTRGMSADLTDLPSQEAAALYAAEASALLRRCEPRAQIESAQCRGTDAVGRLLFEVVMTID